MLFSVLIANYNNSRFIRTSIQSVLDQSYADWEVVLVDDGSTDGFEKIISEFTKDKRIRIFSNTKNFGCGFTKKKCVENAMGSIAGFLDPDDALHPDAIKIMMQAHSDHPSCSLISSSHYVCDECLKVERVAEYTRPLPSGVPYLLVGDGSIHHFSSFKRKQYNITAGISIKNKKAVDQDLYYKLEEVGDVYYINKPLYYYRIHPGAISNAGQGLEAKKYHYVIIEEACLRRIKLLKPKTVESKYWIKKYRTRYFKIKILSSFQRRKWVVFLYSMILFPFVGGWGNIVSYMRKLPKEKGMLLRRSFVPNDEISI